MVDEFLNTAMQVTMQFGPERGIPRVERLLERCPALTREQAHSLLAKCDDVEKEAYEHAGRVRNADLTSHQAEDKLATIFPGLPRQTISRALGQGMYFWWRDNGS